MLNVRRCSCRVRVNLVRFGRNLNFLNTFLKNNELSILVKILLVAVELFHADRQRDMTKLIIAFRNYANAHKNE
jgi:hypothetical protein